MLSRLNGLCYGGFAASGFLFNLKGSYADFGVLCGPNKPVVLGKVNENALSLTGAATFFYWGFSVFFSGSFLFPNNGGVEV